MEKFLYTAILIGTLLSGTFFPVPTKADTTTVLDNGDSSPSVVPKTPSLPTAAVTVAPPVLSTAPGTYAGPQTISITDATPNASIWYTITSGGITTSAKYTGPITVSKSSEIQAIANINGGTPQDKVSTVVSANYVITPAPVKPAPVQPLPVTVAPPVLSTAPGTYASTQTISITDATPNASIWYTITSGGITTSAKYTGPITVSKSSEIQAIANINGGTPQDKVSTVVSANYVITPAPVKPAPVQPAPPITQSNLGPVILYTDVTSGPNSGGEGNNGTYLTIFGTNFGAGQGISQVTINGQPVAQYLLWSNNKIGVQVGHVSSGAIEVIANGRVSNQNKTFTVRPGHIYYIGAEVDNSAPQKCADMLAGNSYATPWGLTNYASNVESNYSVKNMRTPYTYYNCISLGDTLVFLNGVNYPYFDGKGWHSSLTPDKFGATANNFITFMARPGATAQLGGTGWAMAPFRDTSNGYNVISGLTLTGSGANGGAYFSAGGVSTGDRVVGNVITCPDCWGPAGAVMATNGFIMYGNSVENVSTLLSNGSNKEYHAVYVGGNNIEIAWNKIFNTLAYNGIQINHDGDPGFFNQSYHDNDISDVNGSGINLSTIDPSSGYINVYNNIIHHVGVNSASDGGGDDPHSCIAVKGYGSSVAPGTPQIYNNTMYDCSSYLNINPATNASCAILILPKQLNVTTNLVNNIVYQPTYVGTAKQNVYICGGAPASMMSGSHDLFYSDTNPGVAIPSSNLTKVIIANPLFVSDVDFHLQAKSPAISAGIPIGNLLTDFDAVPVPNPPWVGAYQ